MEIVHTEGCDVSALDVDGKDWRELTHEEQKKIMHVVIDKADSDCLHDILALLVDLRGDYHYLYHCEQCGDDVCEHKLMI